MLVSFCMGLKHDLLQEHKIQMLQDSAQEKLGPWKKDVSNRFKTRNNEELNDLYKSPVIVMVKSRMLRWARHVASMGETRKG